MSTDTEQTFLEKLDESARIGNERAAAEAAAQLASVSDVELTAAYLQMREWVKLEAQAHEMRIAPTQDAMQRCAGELHRRLLERFGPGPGKKSGSCSAGTYYTSRTLSVRVVDQAAFKEYIFSNNLRDGIAASANKETVEQYMSAYQTPPPGVEATWVENINIRKS